MTRSSIAQGHPPLSRPIAFVHIQKTAGTSLKFILRNSFGIRHMDVNPVDPDAATFGRDDLDFAHSTNPWLRSISSHEISEPTRHLGDAVMPFTMLRQPVPRMLSHYQHKVTTGRHPPDFARFLADPDNHDFQVRKIAGEADLDKAIELLRDEYFFVGLAERFDASMEMLSALCPYPLKIGYPRKNVAADNSVRAAVEADAHLMAAAEAANRLDQSLWRFVADELFGQQAGAAIRSVASESGRTTLPWRFHASRLYHRGVYRSLLKRERRRRGFR